MSVLVVGGSKGIGAEVVRSLEAQGVAGQFTYLNSLRRAEKLASRCTGWSAIRVDLAAPPERFVASLLENGASAPEVVVFTSAAGLEGGENSRRTFAVNSAGPARLLLALDRAEATPRSVVFVTSYEAHHFGEIVEFDSYELVAESKKYGELFCRQVCAERLRNPARMITISSELVIGSTAHTILSLRDPEAVRSVTDLNREVRMETITERITTTVLAELDGSGSPAIIEVVGDGALV